MWAEGGGFLFKVGINTGRLYRGEMTPGGAPPGDTLGTRQHSEGAGTFSGRRQIWGAGTGDPFQLGGRMGGGEAKEGREETGPGEGRAPRAGAT